MGCNQEGQSEHLTFEEISLLTESEHEDSEESFEEISLLTESEHEDSEESFEEISLLTESEHEDSEESFEEISVLTENLTDSEDIANKSERHDEAQKTGKMLWEFMASEDYLAPSNPGNLLSLNAIAADCGLVEINKEAALKYG
ncbi:uncharacterized protein LOC117103536 [Anneissia japonica]|uniref:uncharacterized protein LOC117103536 n=1 Tax=Anneissia japonica TaxID=1529436 RepID=UPI0014258887|nr:uncharacterized protein LOC117103536 [Anneissia japonica]